MGVVGVECSKAPRRGRLRRGATFGHGRVGVECSKAATFGHAAKLRPSVMGGSRGLRGMAWNILSLILQMISKVIEVIEVVIVSWLLWVCPCIFEDRERVYITIENEKFY